MKKLFAILLSVLMLCSMIPFAAVSAAGDHYIELVADAEEVDAGGELVVEVYMYGHESVGLTGAQIELGFDPAVFELVTYYDEDEEMWMPPIEVGPKFSASSNKYILFAPIDEETGAMERCLVQFQRATATATQAVKTNLFYTVTFKVKDNAVSGDYTIQVTNHNNKNIVLHGPATTEWTMEPITVTVNGVAAGCDHAWNDATCTAPKTCSKCGDTEGTALGHDWADADCDTPKTCKTCGATEGTALGHTPGAAADCVNDQVCTVCNAVLETAKGHTYDYDCDPDCNVCYENRVVTHNVIHVPAKTACVENGNIEYWCCSDCGMAWLDAACLINTNLRAVITPAVRSEHGYADDADIVCEYCGAADEARGEFKIVTAYGSSVSEGGEIAAGVAFRFNANLKGFALVEDTHTVDKEKTNVVFNYNGVAYTMTGVGAVVSNKDDSIAYKLDAADGKRIIAVNADKLYKLNDYSISYVIRVIGIPESCRDIKITANPYLTGVDADGNEIALYSDSLTASYNG